MNVFQSVFMIAVTASLIPIVYAILSGWTRSASTTLQRRSSLAFLVSIVALGATLLIAGVWQAIDGSFVLAAAFGLGVVLMVLAALISRMQLQIATHLVATGETLELTTAQRGRLRQILWAMTALIVVILVLVIGNIVANITGIV